MKGLTNAEVCRSQTEETGEAGQEAVHAWVRAVGITKGPLSLGTRQVLLCRNVDEPPLLGFLREAKKSNLLYEIF